MEADMNMYPDDCLSCSVNAYVIIIINVCVVRSPQRPNGADVDGAAVAAVSATAVRGGSWWGGGEARSVGALSGRAAATGPGRTSMAQRVASAAGAAARPVAAEAPHAAALLPLPASRAPQRAASAASSTALALAQTSAVNLPQWASLDFVSNRLKGSHGLL